MFKLSRLENSTQEIIFIVTFVTSLSLLLGGGFYLILNESTLTVISGSIGKLFFGYLFNGIGFAVFLLAIGAFLIGNYLLPRSTSPRDILKLSPQLIIQILVQFLVVLMSASLLTVFEQYNNWQITAKLTYGAGGFLGWILGGNLFYFFGLYGSLVFIISFSLIVSIASGYIEFLASWYWLVEKSTKLVKAIVTSLKSGTLISFQFLNIQGHRLNKWFKIKMGLAPSIQLDDVIQVKREIQPIEDHSGFSFEDAGIVEQPVIPLIIEGNQKASQSQEKKSPNKNKNITAKKLKKDTPTTKELKLKENNENTEDGQNIEEPQKGFHVEIKKWTKRYVKPDNALLDKVSEPKASRKDEIAKTSAFLEKHLAAFQIRGKIVAIHEGVRLTMFEFLPDPGVKLSKIASLSSDLALVLGAESIRVLTPIPGKTTVGIEVPNKNPQALALGNVINCVHKQKAKHPLPIALGKDVYNKTVVSDISEMPHMLVAGTTGSGKSVFVNNLITSLLYTRSPKELRFIMVDPKMIELSPYNGIPHLLKPVITDVTEAKDALKWAEAEMDKRYQQFADLHARNISSFNEKIKNSSKESAQRASKKEFDWSWQEMPYIVIIVDEMADLILTQGKEVEIPITRIAQKARAAGIHLILATQRPSAEIVTGLIKTNFPTRIAFKVSSAIDSRTILDTSGAEKLLGKGDMLYMPNGKTVERIQSAFLSEEEVRKIVKTIS